MDVRKCLQVYSELVKTLYRYIKYGAPPNRDDLAKLLKGVALWCPMPPDLADAFNFYAVRVERTRSEEELDELLKHSEILRYTFEDLPTSINLELGSLYRLLEEIRV